MWSVSTELVLGGVAGMAKPAGRFSWPTATGQRQWAAVLEGQILHLLSS